MVKVSSRDVRENQRLVMEERVTAVREILAELTPAHIGRNGMYINSVEIMGAIDEFGTALEWCHRFDVDPEPYRKEVDEMLEAYQ